MSADDVTSTPYLLYQAADLSFDFQSETIVASTMLWLTYSREIVPNSYVYLHCRQCKITEVLVNGIPAEFVLNDPLRNLLPSNAGNTNFDIAELDRQYRAALEISRTGELKIKIPVDDDDDESSSDSQPSIRKKQVFRSVNKLPYGVSKDILSRYEALQALLETLKPKVTQSKQEKTSNTSHTSHTSSESKGEQQNNDLNKQEDEDADDNLLENIINRKPPRDLGKLLQVKISYILERKKGLWPGGFVFRHQKQYADSFGGYYGYDGDDSGSSQGSAAKCVYSTSGTRDNQSLYNVDGVRCWLPCLDSLDQRALFDVTLHAPQSMNLVMCSGTKLSKADRFIKRSHLQPLLDNADDQPDIGDHMSDGGDKVGNIGGDVNSNEILAYTSSRFFSLHRMPVSVLGFFIGIGESYQMPLYRCRGRILVALDINDYDSGKNRASNMSNFKENSRANLGGESRNEEDLIKIINQTSYIDLLSDQNSNNGNNNGNDNGNDSVSRSSSSHAVKRTRFEDDNSKLNTYAPLSPTTRRKRNVSFSDETGIVSETITQSNHYFMDKNFNPVKNDKKVEYDEFNYNPRNIYEEKVRHSLLGFDMGLRFIHKLVGKRYHQEAYTQIYIPDLGDNFISFDGFSLIDGKYLHDSSKVFLETPHHLLSMRAYVYGYICSTLPVLGYLQEYLLHGSVGYIIHLYIQSVYGEDESVYNQLKVLDTVLTLEKLHQSPASISSCQTALQPIATMSFPEAYERFLPWYGSYLVHKSIAFFHVIENRVGGSESLRRALHQLIKAPLLHQPSPSLIKEHVNVSSPHILGLTSPDRSQLISINPSMPYITETVSSDDKMILSSNNSNSNNSNDNDNDKDGDINEVTDKNEEQPPLLQLYAPTTPSHYDAYVRRHHADSDEGIGGSPRGVGSNSPSHGDVSPWRDSFGTMASPQFYPQSPDVFSVLDYGGSVFSPKYSPDIIPLYGFVTTSPELMRQSSLTTAASTMLSNSTSVNGGVTSVSFPELLMSDCSTGESFFELLRSVTGVACDLHINVLETMVYSNSTLRGKIDLVLDPKVENKPRNLHLSFDPISGGETNVVSSTPIDVTLKFRIGEVREDRVTEPELTLPALSSQGHKREPLHHSQALFSKPGRRGGSHKKPVGMDTNGQSVAGSIFGGSHISNNNQQHQQHQQQSHSSLIDASIPNKALNILQRLQRHFNLQPWLFDLKLLSETGTNANQFNGGGNPPPSGFTDRPRSALQKARDRDHPLKYCLFDPFMSYLLTEVSIGALPDSLLIEQLFADVDMNDIIRQVSAMRGLATAQSTTLRNFKSMTAGSSSSGLNSANMDAAVRNEKIAALQFQALSDCLLGVNPSPLTAAEIVSGQVQQQQQQQSVFVRVEAAFSLMQWQFDRLPDDSSASLLKHDSTVSSSSNSNNNSNSGVTETNTHWEGAWLLIKVLFDMFFDPITLVFIPQDDTDEWMTYLRNGVLVATSLIKNKKGYTPLEVIELFLHLAEEGTSYESNNLAISTSSTSASKDHWKAILLVTLSRFVLEESVLRPMLSKSGSITTTNNNSNNSNSSSSGNTLNDNTDNSILNRHHNVTTASSVADRIVRFAATELKAALLTAKTSSRMAHTSFSRNHMPSTTYGGLLPAAAISCLGQMDRQAVACLDSFRGRVTPPTSGIISGLNYAQFFLPEGCPLSYSHVGGGGGMFKKSLVSSFQSPLNPPAVRIAALEAYVQICLSSYNALLGLSKKTQLQQQLAASKNQAGGSEEVKPISAPLRILENSFIPAALEAVLTVTRYDPDAAVRQAAATLLLHSLQDLPPRIATVGTTLGHRGLSLGFSDSLGLTFVDPFQLLQRSRGTRSQLSSNACNGLRSNQQGLKKEVKKWWRVMAQFSSSDQIVRSLLMSTWLFVYHDKVPRSVATSSSSPGGALHGLSTTHAQEDYHLQQLLKSCCPSLPVVPDPLESFARVEMRLKHGSSYILSHSKPPGTSVSKSTTASSTQGAHPPAILRLKDTSLSASNKQSTSAGISTSTSTVAATAVPIHRGNTGLSTGATATSAATSLSLKSLSSSSKTTTVQPSAMGSTSSSGLLVVPPQPVTTTITSKTTIVGLTKPSSDTTSSGTTGGGLKLSIKIPLKRTTSDDSLA